MTDLKLGKFTISEAVVEVEKRMVAVGEERDRIDNLIMELEGLKENCREAYDDLQRARDSLSELV